jgi:hypothetical protein
LRAERQLASERELASAQEEQMTQAKLSDPGSAQLQASQPAIEASTTPAASAKVPDPMPIAHEAHPVPPSQPAPVSPATAMRLEEIRRADALRLADEAATTRVFAWRDRLSIAGQTLTTAQLQALNAAAIKEGRRDAEESLALGSTTQSIPMDRMDSFRMREEALIRAHETNLRILQSVGPELTEEQANALRNQFDSGHASRMAGVQAERERAEQRAN